ncbi:MAG: hypothetical protein GPJ54_01925 [Candidatus Heimdallarchaeota archaeon]|nr:hypothetical protein [Candidatus Heimdallarchaeota archaeon]
MKHNRSQLLIFIITIGFLFISIIPSTTTADTQTLNITIHSLKVLDDHDGLAKGSGEIFITIQINDEDIYRIPNSGHYSMDNSDEIDIDRTNTLDMTHGDILKIEVREEDDEGDDTLGYIQFAIPMSAISNSRMTTVNPNDAEIVISITVSGSLDSLTNIKTELDERSTDDQILIQTKFFIFTFIALFIVVSNYRLMYKPPL